MSRFRQLLDKFDGNIELWQTGVVVQNLPPIMLDNDFARSIAVLANAALLEQLESNERALTIYNISTNK